MEFLQGTYDQFMELCEMNRNPIMEYTSDGTTSVIMSSTYGIVLSNMWFQSFQMLR